MLGQLIKKWVLLSIILAHASYATILPERYQMVEAVYQSIADDKELEKWLQIHDTSKNISPTFANGVGSLDQISLDYASIIHAKKSDKIRKIAELSKLFEQNDGGPYSHVLYPYILELQHQNSSSKWRDQEDYFYKLLKDPSGISCPAYKYIHKRLTDRHYVRKHKDKTRRLLSELEKANNFSSVKNTLRIFLNSLPSKQKKSYEEELKTLSNKFPELRSSLARHISFPGSSNSKIDRISYLTRRRHCYSAKKLLLATLREKPKPEMISSVRTQIDNISKCYRSKRRSSRYVFLRSILTPMKKAFGEQGWAYVQLEIAKHLWNIDKYKKARKIVSTLWDKSLSPGDQDIQAESLYLWARIDENEQFYEKASERYQEFIRRFPKNGNLIKAMGALLITHIGLGEWNAAYNLAKEMIYQGREFNEEFNQISSLGFALFWAGRAALELNKREEAVQYWKYAANEFFSTYYGALSHYMVERYTNKKFALQPLHTPKFNAKSLRESFSKPFQTKIRRAETLLKLGLKDQAACEIGEIQDHKGSLQLQTVRALLLYAAGKWLDSIRLYGNIPREYRQTLPYGTEKILFPKKYANNVELYSSKIGIDPDLVFSVIRQESVFNPMAFSGAGARGLMQLMKKTARLEAKRLRKTYVSYQKKRKLIRKSKNSSSLYEIETNIILGTHYLNHLLNRYNHIPISLAAYNAGPTVIGRWRKRFDTSDPLYFIERIPYKETRDYVKLILRNYFYYKKWYGGAFEDLPHLDHLTGYLAALGKPKNAKM
ncbi:MAG: lytic transglycosylase domain-containing protein [Oligoflexales bacterium]|nr:lytic transglycosylase domain-containing protein [Oligoflexales bacterium]